MDDYEKYQRYKRKYINMKNKMNKRQRGGADVFPVNDTLHFWSRQLMEHALFLHLGLEDIKLKKQAWEMHLKWKNFLNKNFYDKGIKVTLETIMLTNEDLAKVPDIDIDRFIKDYLVEMIEFNGFVVEKLRKGEWLGWIYLALGEHMLKEAEYFQMKLKGPAFTPEDEIAFANEHNGEEVGALAGLINPSPDQQKIIDLTRSYAMKDMSKFKEGQALSLDGPPNASEPFPGQWTKQDELFLKGMDATDQAKLIELSIRYGDELSKYAADTNQKIASGQLNSMINPILGFHGYREIARFTETLRALNA